MRDDAELGLWSGEAGNQRVAGGGGETDEIGGQAVACGEGGAFERAQRRGESPEVRLGIVDDEDDTRP